MRRLQEEAGFTLVELLTVLALSSVVLAFVTGTVVHALQTQRRQLAEVTALDDSKVALERVTRDLRGADPLLQVALDQVRLDVNRNGKTDLTADPTIGSLPFLQSADVFVRGATPTDETISYQLESRGALGVVRTLNVPNWESKPVGDGIVIQWNDFESLSF